MREALGDREGIGVAVNGLGMSVFDQGDFADARALNEEVSRSRRELGDQQGIAASLNNLGVVA